MKLSKVTINNYKGLQHLSLDVENISIIIGPNNCSKSTVLQAIDQFGKSDKLLDESCYYRHDTSREISFLATFIEVTEEEIELHGIRNSIHEPTGNFIVRAVYEYGVPVRRSSKTSGEPTHDLNIEGWDGRMGGGNNGSHFLNVFPEILYIPAVRHANEEIKNSSDYIKTLTQLYKEVIMETEEYVSATRANTELQNRINSHTNERISFFQNEVKSFLNDITSTSVDFKINFKPIEEFISSSVNTIFNYNGINTSIEHQGNGVQRTFIVSILKGFRKYRSEFPPEGRGQIAARRPLIIAIEEPELYLHPHVARVFKDTLYNLADDRFFQVIATSHSPNFIDLSKSNRTLVRFSLDLNNDVLANQVSSDIYGLPGDERDKFQALLKFNPHLNEVFFAQQAILVEGDTEVVALRQIAEKLIESGLLSSEVFHKTSIVNCAGKPTMYVVLNVLNNFGIPYTVIHDMDITELGKNGQRRASSTLRQAITINYKIEALASVRANKKFVFQYTFEAEMPESYDKGTSKSYAAYEFLKDKSLDEIPYRLLQIIKSAYGIPLEVPIVHLVTELMQQYLAENPDWSELHEAFHGWQIPEHAQFIRNVWDNISHPFAAAGSGDLTN
jgi:putative ATP-dependent endonuclease of OLD family